MQSDKLSEKVEVKSEEPKEKEKTKSKLFSDNIDLVKGALANAFNTRAIDLLREFRNEKGVISYVTNAYVFAKKFPPVKSVLGAVENFVPDGIVGDLSGQAATKKIEAIEALNTKIKSAKDLEGLGKVLREVSLKEREVFSDRTGKVMEGALEFVSLLEQQIKLQKDDAWLLYELQKKSYLSFQSFCEKELKKKENAGIMGKSLNFLNTMFKRDDKLSEKIKKFSDLEGEIKKDIVEKVVSGKDKINPDLVLEFYRLFDEFKRISRDLTERDSSKSTDTSNNAVFIETLHSFAEFVEGDVAIKKKNEKDEKNEKGEVKKSEEKAEEKDKPPMPNIQ